MLNPQSFFVGQTLRRPGPTFTQADFTNFGALLGTDAPIHTDPDYGRNHPYGTTIAQGMLLLAPFETWMRELIDPDLWRRSGRLRAKLLSPLKAGEAYELSLEVVALTNDQIVLKLEASRGETLLAAGEITARTV